MDRGWPPPLEADERYYLVELSREDDPANAKNWRFSRNETRGIAIAYFSALVFIGPFISLIAAAFITESHLG